ncbi:TspO/MBR family protein [Xanthobacter tagetidis]|uniref:Tryptophan-rich sensory protein n=1 Tax=Xanthobacter tagetidis TaxID=60216 RepID=A0A3L7AET9_9HYPH|nr:TspO/MBR family protein [Xanthobacter tagetidis]MBB6306717.1 tryptophan-rich sensory protein [Xanthobacter tagetidis]RLP78976.1 tryptophan-rich sensory protein [Xanthobacter tagetidis]
MAADTAPNTRLIRFFAVAGLITAVALSGSAVTTPQIPGWYQGLAKPFWTPPNGLFPIAWTTLYALMGVALLRLWGKPPQTPGRTRAIVLFLAQLALNAAWSPVFFGLQAPWPALAIILLLIATLALAIKAAREVDKIAAWLLLPYLAWLCYASTLNAAIAVMN